MSHNPIVTFAKWFVIILVSIWVLGYLTQTYTKPTPPSEQYWENLDSSQPTYKIKSYDYNNAKVTYYTDEDRIDGWKYKGRSKNSSKPSTKSKIEKERLSPLERERLNQKYPNGYDISTSTTTTESRSPEDLIIDSDVDLYDLIEYSYD